MSKIVCWALAFLLLMSSPCSYSAETATHVAPDVTIFVYDYALVSPETLSAAEDDARKAFRKGGIDTEWITCLPKRPDRNLQPCSVVDTTHLMVKILPHAMRVADRARIDVLGNAPLDQKGSGFYAYVFYDRVQSVAQEHRLGHNLLGHVMAHEIAHLLLESRSHAVSGIMSSHLGCDEWRRISEGTMFFTAGESRALREHVQRRQMSAASVTRETASAAGAR